MSAKVECRTCSYWRTGEDVLYKDGHGNLIPALPEHEVQFGTCTGTPPNHIASRYPRTKFDNWCTQHPLFRKGFKS